MAAKKILVVDDEAMVLESVQLTLTHLGYGVESASSGLEALDKLSKDTFDLVVTDRRMPGMTGEQLAAEIKKRCPKMPIVLLTGFPPDTPPPEVDTVLVKPFSVVDLRNTVLELTKGSEDGKRKIP